MICVCKLLVLNMHEMLCNSKSKLVFNTINILWSQFCTWTFKDNQAYCENRDHAVIRRCCGNVMSLLQGSIFFWKLVDRENLGQREECLGFSNDLYRERNLHKNSHLKNKLGKLGFFSEGSNRSRVGGFVMHILKNSWPHWLFGQLDRFQSYIMTSYHIAL